MKVEQIYTGCLAQGAYYIESEGEAVIIDPLRESQPYLEKLQANNVRLKYIFETHFHADFVSGHLDLAEKTGAQIVYGPLAETNYDFYSAWDGEELQVGNLSFKVLHTPGHTMESSTYLLRDKEGEDYAIFTGDTLFLGDVGRPDLAIKQGALTKEDLAALLYDSLRNKIMPLSDNVIVYPGHGAGSACGKNLSSETYGYLGDQKKLNYALREDMSKEEFVREVTAGLTPPPQYFAKNALMNKQGYESFDEVLAKGEVSLSPEKFLEIAEQKEALILDVRSEEDYAKKHIPGSIFIGLNGSFAPWVGSLIPDIKQTILLLTPEGQESEAVTRLARVGYDNTLGFLQGGIESWEKAGNETDKIRTISAEEYAKFFRFNQEGMTLDVRKPTEYLSESLNHSVNFPLDYINNNMDKLPTEENLYLHCAGGYRSVIAASILKARGFHKLINISGGWKALAATDIPKSDFTCPTKMAQDTIDKALAEFV